MAKILEKSSPPEFNPRNDYYKEYWRVFLQNENLMSEIDQIAH
jgi:hypothetical protein